METDSEARAYEHQLIIKNAHPHVANIRVRIREPLFPKSFIGKFRIQQAVTKAWGCYRGPSRPCAADT